MREGEAPTALRVLRLFVLGCIVLYKVNAFVPGLSISPGNEGMMYVWCDVMCVRAHVRRRLVSKLASARKFHAINALCARAAAGCTAVVHPTRVRDTHVCGAFSLMVASRILAANSSDFS